MQTALVTGAAGFVGHHMVRYLKKRKYYVIGVDIARPRFSQSEADKFVTGDLKKAAFASELFKTPVDEVYQFAADMGGAGFTFSGVNDADIMHNSLLISLNILKSLCNEKGRGTKVFYPSSACIYPEIAPSHPNYPNFAEEMAYPANPESEYGWEKIFCERLYLSFMRNYGIDVSIARFHTIFGPECVYDGGREKVPAALARKVIQAKDNGEIKIWGDGHQSRSFLYIDDCLEAVYKLVHSDFNGPVNIGSDELISINELAQKYISMSGKSLELKHIDGPVGAKARNSDNHLIKEKLDWQPTVTLDQGLENTFFWIQEQLSD